MLKIKNLQKKGKTFLYKNVPFVFDIQGIARLKKIHAEEVAEVCLRSGFVLLDDAGTGIAKRLAPVVPAIKKKVEEKAVIKAVKKIIVEEKKKPAKRTYKKRATIAKSVTTKAPKASAKKKKSKKKK